MKTWLLVALLSLMTLSVDVSPQLKVSARGFSVQ